MKKNNLCWNVACKILLDEIARKELLESMKTKISTSNFPHILLICYCVWYYRIFTLMKRVWALFVFLCFFRKKITTNISLILVLHVFFLFLSLTIWHCDSLCFFLNIFRGFQAIGALWDWTSMLYPYRYVLTWKNILGLVCLFPIPGNSQLDSKLFFMSKHINRGISYLFNFNRRQI